MPADGKTTYTYGERSTKSTRSTHRASELGMSECGFDGSATTRTHDSSPLSTNAPKALASDRPTIRSPQLASQFLNRLVHIFAFITSLDQSSGRRHNYCCPM